MPSKLKLEEVEVFGGKCQCPTCTVSHPDFLEFAHPNLDGGKKKKTRKINGRKEERRVYVGDTLLRHLKKADWANETKETGKVLMLCRFCHVAHDRGFCCKEFFHGLRSTR